MFAELPVNIVELGLIYELLVKKEAQAEEAEADEEDGEGSAHGTAGR